MNLFEMSGEVMILLCEKELFEWRGGMNWAQFFKTGKFPGLLDFLEEVRVC